MSDTIAPRFRPGDRVHRRAKPHSDSTRRVYPQHTLGTLIEHRGKLAVYAGEHFVEDRPAMTTTVYLSNIPIVSGFTGFDLSPWIGQKLTGGHNWGSGYAYSNDLFHTRLGFDSTSWTPTTVEVDMSHTHPRNGRTYGWEWVGGHGAHWRRTDWQRCEECGKTHDPSAGLVLCETCWMCHKAGAHCPQPKER